MKVTAGLPWRRKIASLNYLLSSHVWRQDHNGFTHQDPGFIDHVVNKKAEIVRVYLPPDANCLLSVVDHCLRSRHYVNVVVAGKHPAPQWLTMDGAINHCSEGIGIWQWASNDQRSEPDVVMACAGDVPTLETLAAVSILRRELPALKVRVVNVVDLMKLQPPSEHPHGLSDSDFDASVQDSDMTEEQAAFAFEQHRRETQHETDALTCSTAPRRRKPSTIIDRATENRPAKGGGRGSLPGGALDSHGDLLFHAVNRILARLKLDRGKSECSSPSRQTDREHDGRGSSGRWVYGSLPSTKRTRL